MDVLPHDLSGNLPDQRPRLALPEASLTQPVPVGDGRVGSRDSVARACEALAVPCYGPTFDS